MGLSREDKQDYRRKRNSLGWLIAAGWVLFWCFRPSDGSWAGSANHYFMAMVAIITAPFAFLISHYVARAEVDTAARERERQAAATAAAEQRRQEAEQVARQRRVESEGREARRRIDRGELIRKLGAVADYLKLLANTTDPDRALLIEQSIDKELRDLVAKHDGAALVDLLGGDDAARLALGAVAKALEERGALSSDATVLKMALLRSPTT